MRLCTNADQLILLFFLWLPNLFRFRGITSYKSSRQSSTKVKSIFVTVEGHGICWIFFTIEWIMFILIRHCITRTFHFFFSLPYPSKWINSENVFWTGFHSRELISVPQFEWPWNTSMETDSVSMRKSEEFQPQLEQQQFAMMMHLWMFLSPVERWFQLNR